MCAWFEGAAHLSDHLIQPVIDEDRDEFDVDSLGRAVPMTTDEDSASLEERLADLSALMADAADDDAVPTAIDLVDDEDDVQTTMSAGITAAAIADSDLSAVSLDDPVRMY